MKIKIVPILSLIAIPLLNSCSLVSYFKDLINPKICCKGVKIESTDLYLKADSEIKELGYNRSICVSKNVEEKEFEINFIFKEGCEEIGNEKYSFCLLFLPREIKKCKDNDNVNYSFMKNIEFYDESREEIKKDEFSNINVLYITDTKTIYMSYKNVGEEGINIFDNDKFPIIRFAFLRCFEGYKDGAYIYLESNNYFEE